MFRHPWSRLALVALLVALASAVAGAPARAQQTVPAPAARPAEAQTQGIFEGSVKKVDPGAGTVQVSSGLFGLLGRTLQVTGDTQIQVEGRQATLADIQEGANVKASYEVRDGKSVATRLEVMPPGRTGARSGAGQMPGKTE
jgi:Cu/Ag efflux protein CusF